MNPRLVGVGFVLAGVILTLAAWWLNNTGVGTFVSLALAGPLLLSEGMYSLLRQGDMRGYTRVRLLMHGTGLAAGVINCILLLQQAQS